MYLVRHAAQDGLGRTLCGRMPGISLNAEGRRQAALVAERLAREPISAVYASPLERAHETAEAIATRCGIRCDILDDLNEIDFGEWTGLRFDELEPQPAWQAWNSARSGHSAPGGESMPEAQARILAAIERLRRDHAGEAVVIVSHCDLIRAAVAHHLGLSLDLIMGFDIDPASISVLVVGEWGSRIARLNEVAS